MVRPMSSASQPISIASVASAMRSPAFGPTMPQPISRCVVLVPERLGQPLVAAERQRTSARGPREHRLAELHAPFSGFGLGDADPGHFRVCVGDRGDRLGVEGGPVPARDFGRNLALVGRLVRQHRLADDVADGEDVMDVGPHLAVDLDEAVLVHGDPRRVGADRRPVRPAADRHQNRVECFRFRAVRAFIGDGEPLLFGLDRRHLGFQAGYCRKTWRGAWPAARRCRRRPRASTGPSSRSTVIPAPSAR